MHIAIPVIYRDTISFPLLLDFKLIFLRMCGILGIFNYSGRNTGLSLDILNRMTATIKHRGPDDEGVYISPDQRIGMGFRRLSIIDLSNAGHQPMSNPEKTIWITFNGEIYNHQELRRDLEAKGYRYRSKTDTETIIYAYQEYGIGFIEKLYGMFGIAIWDARSQKLLLIRDRLGIKPVYYTQQNGQFLYASEIKALLEHPDVPRQINSQGLYDYLSFYITPPNESLFAGIHKLEAGHYLIVNSDGAIHKEQHWDMTHRTESYSSKDLEQEGFCVENIRHLLRDSIRLRMIADVPFGVLLSGGVDSSLNVALMSEQMDRQVQTFSAGFKDLEKHNELQQARKVAEYFGTNHHEVLIGEEDALDFLPRMIWHQDEPNADPACIPMYFVSKLARESGTVVVQVGEGADEEFAGYSHYLRELKYYQHFYNLPKPLTWVAYSLLKSTQRHEPITEYARRALQRDTPFFYGAVPAFSEETKPLLLASSLFQQSQSSSRISSAFFQKLSQQSVEEPQNHLTQMMYYDMKNRLAELLLMRVDKMSMAVSIEARVPFLDHRIVEMAFRIPQSLKIKDGVGKYILKKAAEGILPHEIIYRRKQGLNSPIAEWLRTKKLSKYANEVIFSSPFITEGIFKESYVRFLFERHLENKRNYSKQLWSLMILSLWYERYFDNRQITIS